MAGALRRPAGVSLPVVRVVACLDSLVAERCGPRGGGPRARRERRARCWFRSDGGVRPVFERV